MTRAPRIAPMPRWLLLAAAAIAVAGCASSPVAGNASGASARTTARPVLATSSTVPQAKVNLASASGSLVSGRLSLRPMGTGVHISGEIGGLGRNSTHGIHIHEKGDCSAADASSAGGHFNPSGNPHGKAGSGSHHAGDMDNLVANPEGVAAVNAHVLGVVLGGNVANDLIGRAVVVHATADDYASQPAGNAGARVACGVIVAGG